MRAIISDYRSRPVVNQIRNPSLETDNTGWTTVSSGDAPGESAPSRLTSGGHEGNAYMRQTWLTSPGGGALGSELRDIVIDPTGAFIYAAQYSGSNLYKFSTAGGDGSYIGSVFSIGSMRSVAVDPSGNIYVSRTSGASTTVEKRTSTGTLVWSIDGSTSGTVFAGAQFDGSPEVAIDSASNVYVSDIKNSRIVKFNSAGSYILQWGSVGTTDGLFSFFGLTANIAIGPNDDVFVVGYDAGAPLRCQRFSSSGVYLSKTILTTNTGVRYQLQCVDSSGNLIIIQNTDVVKKAQDNTTLLTIPNIAPGSGYNVAAVAIDAAGNFYVLNPRISTDRPNTRIMKFNSAGTYINEIVRMGGAKTVTGSIPMNLTERIATGTNAKYGASVWVRSSVQQRVRLDVRHGTSSNPSFLFSTISGPETVIPANTWTQLVYDNWSPPNPWVGLQVSVVPGTNAVVWSPGDTFDVDGMALYEYPRVNTNYFDGNSPRFGWSGTANNSYSVGYPTTTP